VDLIGTTTLEDCNIMKEHHEECERRNLLDSSPCMENRAQKLPQAMTRGTITT
jgi:hypothetical protein